MPTIKEMATKENITDELVLVKGATVKDTYGRIEDVVIEDGYTIKSTNGDELGYIVLKKETKKPTTDTKPTTPIKPTEPVTPTPTPEPTEPESPTTPTEPDDNNKEDDIITLTDKESEVKLVTKKNVVPKNTLIVVKEVDKTIHKELHKYWEKYFAYDITLQSNGVAIQPSGKVRISIPIPSYFDTSKIVVYRVTSTGEKVRYDMTVEGDFAVIETDHFSVYVIAEEDNNGSGNQSNDVTNGENNETQNELTTEKDNNQSMKTLDKEPKTGTENYEGLVTIIALVSLMGIVILRVKK